MASHQWGRQMKPGDQLAVWLRGEAAAQILGLGGEYQRDSRWVAIGKFDSEWPVGIWLDLEGIEERKKSSKEVDVTPWRALPTMCLIRWDFIITAQLMNGKSSKIGFEIATHLGA
jgi:hypothetical protein